MSYGSTLIPATGMSPLELIMSRRIKTTIPTHPNKWPNLNKVKGKMLYTKREAKYAMVGDMVLTISIH